MFNRIQWSCALVAMVAFFAASSSSNAVVSQISLGSFIDGIGQDFDGNGSPTVPASNTTISPTGAFFRRVGIANATADPAIPTRVDANNFNQTGNSLYVENGTGNLLLVADGTTPSNPTVPDKWTLDLIPNAKATQFGFSVSDSSNGVFNVEFFSGGSSVGSINLDPAGTGFVGAESSVAFDRVEISGVSGDTGYGLDNITIGNFGQGTVQTALANFTDAMTLDFESLNNGDTLANDDPLFQTVGIGRIDAVPAGGSRSDDNSFNFTGNSLYVEAGTNSLIVFDSASDPDPRVPDTWEITLASNVLASQFGFSISDSAAASFEMSLFLDNQLVGIEVFETSGTAFIGFESQNLFNRIVLTSIEGDRGFGLDNITLGNKQFVVPEPASLALLGMGAVAFARRRRRIA